MERAMTAEAKMASERMAKARRVTQRVTRAKVLESAKRRLREKAKAKELDVEGPSPETSLRTPATIAIKKGTFWRTWCFRNSIRWLITSGMFSTFR